MSIKSVTVAALLVASLANPTSARAENSGVYMKATGGVGWLGESTLEGSAGIDGGLDPDTGWASGLALGYDFGRWRLEGEMLYRTNEIDQFKGEGLPADAAPGDFSSLGIAANALYEGSLFGSRRVSGYLGAGVVWFEEVDMDFTGPAGEFSYSSDDWGVQVFAGATYWLTDRWSLNAEVRHLFGGSVDLSGEGPATGRVEADYDHSLLLLGIGYRF